MHLSPDYKSELTSILGKRCKWPVESVTSNLEMQPRHVYVTPQNSNIHVEGNTLMLDKLPKNYSSAPSIDDFLSSLAKSKGNHSIGVILSGFGKDGSKGILDIHENRGFIMAQLPETAEHKDMPLSAVRTEKIDAVLPVEQIFDEINQYIVNFKTISQTGLKAKSIDAIFELLEKRSGTDFSLYKPTTIMRRINHRIEKLRLASLTDYFSMIKNSPKELDKLFETVLIGVTQFFRDEKAFESLEKTLMKYLEEKKPGDAIRIWCVGCATGEEPYSIAILLHELLGPNISKYHVQIFASDIDERALNFARQGLYNKESLENLGDELIKRYFEKRNGNHFEIKKSIKQYTLFTRHDISNDPPFVRLDLVVCRNLLIYFNNSLQKQSFQIFHYSLRPKGLLFLGKSESTGVAADLFSKLNTYKIFRKAEASLDYDLRFSRFKGLKERYASKGKTNQRSNMTIVEAAKETLYYKYEHPFVIINEQAEIKEINGSLRLYLEIGQGSMNANLYKMSNKEFVTIIKATISQVKKTGVPHVSQTVKFKVYDIDHFVKIRVAPIIHSVGEVQYFIVSFEKIEPYDQILDLQKKMTTSDFTDLRNRELEDELEATKEHLQIFTEELEANNEELQTINEELQSANEELKSSNEELETGNEELQSANEELNTANNELRLTNEMLIEKEKELQEEKEVSDSNEAIYRTMAQSIPNGSVGILNQSFEIQYLDGKIFQEVGADPKALVGKSMPEINPDPYEVKRLKKLCADTLEGKPGEIIVRFNDKYYSVRTTLIELPHKSEQLILYLTQDVTKETKDRIKLQTTLDAASLIVFEYNFEEDVVVPNEQISTLLAVEKGVPVKMKNILHKIHPDDIKKIKKKSKKSLKSGTVDLEICLSVKDENRYFRLNGRILFDNNKIPEIGIASIIDITEDKKLLDQVQKSEERFKRIADGATIIIWRNNLENHTTFINKEWFNYTGSTKEESYGLGWQQFIHPEDRKMVPNLHRKAAETEEAVEVQYRVKGRDGTYKWFLNYAKPYYGIEDKFEGYIGSVTNISQQKDFTDRLQKMVSEKTQDLEKSNDELVKINMNLESYAHIASHDLQEPVRKIRTFNSFLLNQSDKPETVVKYAKKIESSAERMTTLIKDILDYSKLTSSAGKMEEIDLNEILEEIKGDLELFMEERGGTIEIDDLGEIRGMGSLLIQLFSNLIKNGIKYNENAPKIKISSDEITGKELSPQFNVHKNRKYKALKFNDNGIGIDPEQFDTIFEPFKRLHSKSEYTGTGIGLAICKRIVDLHDGFITVESKKGEGTCFTVYLPLRKK